MTIPSNYPLPELNKKVIYLDQFAISNMMKALNPETKAFKDKRVDPYWLTLFQKLDRLSKLQLIACPDSTFQEDESLMWPECFKALREMYRYLSHGLSFRNPGDIKRIQLREHAQNWIEENPEKELNLDAQDVIREEINAWQDPLRFDRDLSAADSNREGRKQVHTKFVEIYTDWQTEKDTSFDDRFEGICGELGWSIGEGWRRKLKKRLKALQKLMEGSSNVNINDFFRSESEKLMECISSVFDNHGIKGSDLLKKTAEYLLDNPYLETVPYIRIHSLLFTVFAKETAHEGRKKPPDKGMYTDVQILSLLLPYCDAIFIDKGCHGLLKKIPQRYKFNYGTKIFSLSNKATFLRYLDEIESQASEEHINKVKEVYGENWLKPYTSLYRKQ